VILLKLISWPYFRKHLLRSLLTTAGIILGVALLVAMRTANQSVLSSFNETVDRIAGKAQLQVQSGDTGFPEDVLERAQAVPQVRAAAPVIEASVDTRLKGEGRLLILAVDFTGDRSLRDYDFEQGDEDVVDDPLVFLAQPDSLILSRDFAARNGLRTGQKITLDTVLGPRPFTIRGILKEGGMASAFGGNLGIMDIYAAQQVFGRGRRFDRIDIGLKEGVPLEQGEAALTAALGPGFTVEPPSGRGQQFESLLSVYSSAMNISSFFALFIGMFIIYNSFSIAVTQRRSEIGILRALGATRGQIRWLFLGESVCAGLIGSAIGLGVGLVLSRVITILTGRLLEGFLGVAQNPRQIAIEPRLLLAVALTGIVTSMIAAWIPARNAANVEPVRALQKGSYQVLGGGENRLRRLAAVVFVAASLICLALTRYGPVFYAGYLLMILAGLLLTPFLSLELSKLLRIPMRAIRPVEGSLAADSLIQAPRRTSATVAALMLSLALVIGTGGVARSSYDTIDRWASEILNPDLFVSPSESIVAHDFRFPISMQKEIAEIPGIDEVQAVRRPRIPFKGIPAMLLVTEFDKLSKRVNRTVVAGDAKTMDAVVGQEKGVMLSETLATRHNMHLGDTLELNTPSGLLRMPVVGIVSDFSNQLGTILIDRKVYVRMFHDDTVDLFRIYTKPGVAPADVRSAINDQLGHKYRLFILMNQNVRDYVRSITNQWFGMTYLQLFVAVTIAVLGIVNTLTVSISDRRRELGVLRAVGGLRGQIRGTIWMEATTIGMIGLLLGNAIGAVNLYYELGVIGHDMAGFALHYSFPVSMAALLVPVILAAAFGAALLPAETAVRGSLVEALEYE
jgi:putative ABC transport system permease protein